MKKYKANYVTWGHMSLDETIDLVPPDQSGPWTLESHDAVESTAGSDGSVPHLVHTYVWSQEEGEVFAKLPSKFRGVDVLARLEQLDGLQARNRHLLEANTTLQHSLSHAIKECDKAKEFEAERAAIEQQRQIIDGLYKNPLKNLKSGPSNPGNTHINAVLWRVWSLGFVSHATGKVEFLSAFYNCTFEAAEKETARWADPANTKFNGSDRIKFLERQLEDANAGRRAAANENAQLREELDRAQNALLKAEQRINDIALNLAQTRQGEKPF